jgi:hypothetical protein
VIHNIQFDLDNTKMSVEVNEYGFGWVICDQPYDNIKIEDWRFEFGGKQYQICCDDNKVWQLMEVVLQVVATGKHFVKERIYNELY